MRIKNIRKLMDFSIILQILNVRILHLKDQRLKIGPYLKENPQIFSSCNFAGDFFCTDVPLTDCIKISAALVCRNSLVLEKAPHCSVKSQDILTKCRLPKYFDHDVEQKLFVELWN